MRVGIHGERPTRWLPRAPAEFTRRPTPCLSAAAPRRKTRFARVLDETRDFERLKRSPMCETRRTMHTANAGSGARLGQSVDTATGKTLRSESRRQAMGFTRRGHRNPQRPGWGDRQLRLASQTLSGLTASWLLPTAAPAGAAVNARLSVPLPGVAGGGRWLRWRGRTRGVHRRQPARGGRASVPGPAAAVQAASLPGLDRGRAGRLRRVPDARGYRGPTLGNSNG